MKPVHREGDGFEVDYSERAGFLTGKSEAIARWRAKKEDEAFARLCRKLYARKKAAAARARDPEAARERCRRWRAANHPRMRASERELRRKKRAAKLRALGIRVRIAPRPWQRLQILERVCEVCGKKTDGDSLAWSYDARRAPPLPGHTHGSCANCAEYALAWRGRLLEKIGRSEAA